MLWRNVCQGWNAGQKHLCDIINTTEEDRLLKANNVAIPLQHWRGSDPAQPPVTAFPPRGCEKRTQRVPGHAYRTADQKHRQPRRLNVGTRNRFLSFSSFPRRGRCNQWSHGVVFTPGMRLISLVVLRILISRLFLEFKTRWPALHSLFIW